MKAKQIACVILASGLSKRFGDVDKLTANLCGQSVLSHVLQTAKTVGFGEIFCVMRPDSMQSDESVTRIENHNSEAGQGHALRLGLESAREKGWESCLVMLGDMPLVSASYLRMFINKTNQIQSFISMNESIRMPPALFNSAAIDHIISQKSGQGARAVFDEIDLVTVQLEEGASLDVDTPEDLARVASMMKAGKI